MIDTRWLESFWLGVAVHLWQTAVFLLGLAVVAWWTRYSSARVTASLYWIGVLKLVLPLPLLGPLSERAWTALTGSAPAAATAAEGGWATVSVWMYPVARDSAATASLPPAVLAAWTALWLFGCFLALRRLFRGYTMSIAHTLDPHDLAPDNRAKLTEVMAVAALTPDSVRCVRGGSGAAVHGIVRPRIVLPERLVRGLERVELLAVLVHEREHLRRRDPMRYAAVGVVRAIFWFYPPVWWLARRIRESTEMVCDEAVVRTGVSPSAYCRSLARALKLGLAGSPVGILGHRGSTLKSRLERIRSSSSRRYEAMFAHRILLALALAAALAVSMMPFAPTALDAHAGGKASTGWERLDDADRPVTVDFRQADAAEILRGIESTSGITLRVAGKLPERNLDMTLYDTPLREALDRLGNVAGLRFEVTGPRSLDVYPIHVAGMDGITSPSLVKESRAQPVYPEEARADGIEGTVILQVLVDRHGVVDEIEVLNSKPRDFRPFVDSAVEAVRQWRYEPATRDGDPVDVYFTVVVNFSLDSKEKGDREPVL